MRTISRSECEYCGQSLQIGGHSHGGKVYGPVRVTYIRADQTEAGIELARMEIDTALARLGQSEHDVRLSLERAKAYLSNE
jgi:hypothetical protein